MATKGSKSGRSVCTHPAPVKGPGQVIPGAEGQHSNGGLRVQSQLIQTRQDPAHLGSDRHRWSYDHQPRFNRTCSGFSKHKSLNIFCVYFYVKLIQLLYLL